jgi:hypothetical protein
LQTDDGFIPPEFKDVVIQGTLVGSRQPASSFSTQKQPEKFFRPGQVFSLKVTFGVCVRNRGQYRRTPVDFNSLQLEPATVLKERAEANFLEDRKSRLSQIHALPLKKMARYCREIINGQGMVFCKICNPNSEPPSDPTLWWTKEDWAAEHFRFEHWECYFPMVYSTAHPKTGPWRTYEPATHPDTAQPLPVLEGVAHAFIPGSWISLDDVSKDTPMLGDDHILGMTTLTSFGSDFTRRGLIRRCIVLRAGEKLSLCIGIHT